MSFGQAGSSGASGSEPGVTPLHVSKRLGKERKGPGKKKATDETGALQGPTEPGETKGPGDHMSSVSIQIREAISAAFPAPKDQHLTVMVPGKVIDFGNSRSFALSHSILTP